MDNARDWLRGSAANDWLSMAVVSDGSWSSSLEGPIRTNDVLDGETYDARRAMHGWDAPGFDAADLDLQLWAGELRTFVRRD